jgi:hypothetical protein
LSSRSKTICTFILSKLQERIRFTLHPEMYEYYDKGLHCSWDLVTATVPPYCFSDCPTPTAVGTVPPYYCSDCPTLLLQRLSHPYRCRDCPTLLLQRLSHLYRCRDCPAIRCRDCPTPTASATVPPLLTPVVTVPPYHCSY